MTARDRCSRVEGATLIAGGGRRARSKTRSEATVFRAVARVRFASALILAGLCTGAAGIGCSGGGEPGGVPPTTAPGKSMRLPEGEAGRVVARAIEAAGGWGPWRSHQDASFVSTLAVFDGTGRMLSESIFLHRLQLHAGVRTRLDSIGLAEEVVFGFDGEREWMLRGGRAVTTVSEMAFTRFHALTSAHWFALPFILAETPSGLSYEGSESFGDTRWEKVRAEFGDATFPVDWLLLYFDAETGLLDRVLASVRAEFLNRRLWVGRWLDYREVGGLKRERRRAFYPGTREGRITGPLAAEQLIEHVEFDRSFPASLFERPLSAGGGAPAG